MGNGKQRDAGSGGIVPPLRTVHRRLDRSHQARWWAPRETLSACAALALLLCLPDLANILPPERAWSWWLALTQLCSAALCLLAIYAPRIRAMSTILWAGALWYVVQGIDELVDGNYFGAGLWEYPIMAAYLSGIYLHLRNEHRKGTS